MSDVFLEYAGVSMKALYAAFAGGVASMFFVPGGLLVRSISLFLGMISAIFLSPYFVALARLMSPAGGDGLERAVVFMSGVLGLVFLGGVYGVVERFRQRAAKIADKTIDKIG
jgi:hypothetical protein